MGLACNERTVDRISQRHVTRQKLIRKRNRIVNEKLGAQTLRALWPHPPNPSSNVALGMRKIGSGFSLGVAATASIALQGRITFEGGGRMGMVPTS